MTSKHAPKAMIKFVTNEGEEHTRPVKYDDITRASIMQVGDKWFVYKTLIDYERDTDTVWLLYKETLPPVVLPKLNVEAGDDLAP